MEVLPRAKLLIGVSQDTMDMARQKRFDAQYVKNEGTNQHGIPSQAALS